MMSEEYIQLSNHTNIISTLPAVLSNHNFRCFQLILSLGPIIFLLFTMVYKNLLKKCLSSILIFYVYHECTVGKKPIKAQMHIEYTHGIRLCNLVLI